MYTNEQIIQHWLKSLAPNANKEFWMQKAVSSISKYLNWELREVEISTILNYINSPLEFDYFFNAKVERYIDQFKDISEMPAIIAVPIDVENKHPFLEDRYTEEVEWEPLDGFHRIVVAHRLGESSIKCFTPMEMYK